MKKLFLVLAIASLGFVSCNNDAADKDAEAKRVADSTHTADSLAAAALAAPTTDTTVLKVDTSSKMSADTTKK